MWTKLIYFCLASSAFAQVPQGFTAVQDTHLAPQLSFLAYWQPVAGATSYRVYDGPAPSFGDAACPANLPFDSEGPQTFYADDPIHNWYLLPITGNQWKKRVWCYQVSAVVNGVESAKTPAKSVAIGNGGYVFFGFRGPGTYSPIDKCAGGPSLPLQSTNIADYEVELWYTDANKVQHFFNTFNGFERNVFFAIWHAPAIAKDGTVIPWDESGSYGYKFTYKPLNKSVEGFWNPRGTVTPNVYIQVNVDMLLDPGQPDNGAQCALGYFATDALWNE